MGCLWITLLATFLHYSTGEVAHAHIIPAPWTEIATSAAGAAAGSAGAAATVVSWKSWLSVHSQHAEHAQHRPVRRSLSSKLPSENDSGQGHAVQCLRNISFISFDLNKDCNSAVAPTYEELKECLIKIVTGAIPTAAMQQAQGIDIHMEAATVVSTVVRILRQDEKLFKEAHLAHLVLSVSLGVEVVLQNFFIAKALFEVFDFVNILPSRVSSRQLYIPFELSWISRQTNVNWVVEYEPDISRQTADSSLTRHSGIQAFVDGTWLNYLATAKRLDSRRLSCAQLRAHTSLNPSLASAGTRARAMLQVVHLTDLGDNTTFTDFNVTTPPGVHDVHQSAVVHTATKPTQVSAHQDPNWLAITIIPGLAVVSLMVLAFRRLLYPKANITAMPSDKHSDGGTELVEQQMPVLANPSFLKLLCHVQPSTGVGWVIDKTQSLARTSVPVLLLKVPQHGSQGSSSVEDMTEIITESGLATTSSRIKDITYSDVDIKQADVDMQIDLTADIEVPDDPNALLGQGAYGWVYKGIYKGHPVAVKLLSRMFKEGYIPPQDLAQFEQEMHILSKVRHENIVHLFGGCLVPPNIFLVEELLEFSLADYVHGRRVPMQLAELLAVIRGVACGLCVLHPSIIHRDLKPGNVLLDRRGSIKISDFGLARAKMTSYLSTQNLMAGTIPYMAPECFNGQRGAVTEKSDIYSLAIIMVECLTGRSPWEGWDTVGILCQVAVQKKRPKLPDDPTICPPQLRSLIQDCWKTNPQDRPTAEQVVQRVIDMQEHLQQQLPPGHMFQAPPAHGYSHSSCSSSSIIIQAPLQDVEDGLPSIPEYQALTSPPRPSASAPISLTGASPSPSMHQPSTPQASPQPADMPTHTSLPSAHHPEYICGQEMHHSAAHATPGHAPPLSPLHTRSVPLSMSASLPVCSSPGGSTPALATVSYPPSTSRHETCIGGDTHPNSCGSDDTSPLLSPASTASHTPITSPGRIRGKSPIHSPHKSRPVSGCSSPVTPRPVGWNALAALTSRLTPPQASTSNSASATPSRSPASRTHRELFPADAGMSPASYIRDRPEPSVLHALMTNPVLRSPPRALHSAPSPPHSIIRTLTIPPDGPSPGQQAYPRHPNTSPSLFARTAPPPSQVIAMPIPPLLGYQPSASDPAAAQQALQQELVRHITQRAQSEQASAQQALVQQITQAAGSEQVTAQQALAQQITQAAGSEQASAQQALQQDLVRQIAQQAQGSKAVQEQAVQQVSAPLTQLRRFVSPFAGHTELAIKLQAASLPHPSAPAWNAPTQPQ